MSFSGAAGISFKKFESQDEVDEKKKKRQEEWEKVRKPDDPEECPEVPIDNRCLYDRLEEQRQKQQDEFEEKVAFRNQVKRLDEDEVEFLEFVSETQQEANKARNQEEAQIISELKSAKVVKIEDQKLEEKKSRQTPQQSNKKSQMALLAGAVKRKGSEESSQPKRARTATDTSEQKETEQDSDRSEDKPSSARTTNTTNQVAKVIGIRPAVLPGLTHYEDSSDSLSSSSDSDVDFPLHGRSNVCVYVKQNVPQHQ